MELELFLLGGYVKIAGMIDESMDTEHLNKEPEPWEFRSKPAWQRLIIMLGGVAVNIISRICNLRNGCICLGKNSFNK